MYNFNFDNDHSHQEFVKQRKASEELWSLCDLKSQYDDAELLDDKASPFESKEEKLIKLHECVESDINTNCVSQQSASDIVNNNCYSSNDLIESIEVEAKVKLCLNRKDVVIKR